MSDPIRKVGGTPAATPESTGSVGASFGAALEAAQGTSQAAPATNEIASALRAGDLSAQQAVDALVARALNSPAAQTLSDAGRADLARHLRNTLAEDPTLRALQADLTPGSLRESRE